MDDVAVDFTSDEAYLAATSRIAAAEEEGLEEEGSQWQGLIDRARARNNLQRYFDDDWDGFVLQENDALWEIGCKVSFTNIL